MSLSKVVVVLTRDPNVSVVGYEYRTTSHTIQVSKPALMRRMTDTVVAFEKVALVDDVLHMVLDAQLGWGYLSEPFKTQYTRFCELPTVTPPSEK